MERKQKKLENKLNRNGKRNRYCKKTKIGTRKRKRKVIRLTFLS